MTMIWFHPRARTIVVCKLPPATSALSQLCGYSRGEVLEWQVRRLQTIQKQGERKEYFTERSSSWENQVTLVTPKGNREKGFLTSTRYCREVKDGIYQPTGNSSCLLRMGLTHLHIFDSSTMPRTWKTPNQSLQSGFWALLLPGLDHEWAIMQGQALGVRTRDFLETLTLKDLMWELNSRLTFYK